MHLTINDFLGGVHYTGYSWQNWFDDVCLKFESYKVILYYVQVFIAPCEGIREIFACGILNPGNLCCGIGNHILHFS